MRSLNEPGRTVVRLVRGKIEGTPDPDVPGAWRVDRIPTEALDEGRVWPQSAASQLVGLAVGARPGERTLDLCAAPGGKATMLAGEVTAVEINEARARELEENARRLGASNVRVVVADGRALPSELTGFDRALVDAPCSGLGVLNRRPDLRWRAEPLPELQLELLRAAAERVRRAARSSTRSARSTRTSRRRSSTPSGLEVDRTLADEWPRFRHARRPEFLQTLPHVHGTAGFFVARLSVPEDPMGIATCSHDQPPRSSHAHARLCATPQPRARVGRIRSLQGRRAKAIQTQ